MITLSVLLPVLAWSATTSVYVSNAATPCFHRNTKNGVVVPPVAGVRRHHIWMTSMDSATDKDHSVKSDATTCNHHDGNYRGRVGRIAIYRSKSSPITTFCTNLSLYMYRTVLLRKSLWKQLREEQMNRNNSAPLSWCRRA
jgi:hypothetical protein